MPQVTFQVMLDKVAPHLKKSQYGAVVAYAMGLKGFHSVRVWKTMMEISLNLSDFSGKADKNVSDLEQEIFSEIRALWEIDQVFCPCGCMAPIALQNCIRLTGEMTENGIPPEVLSMLKVNNPIGAIREYRKLTGASLRDAKEKIDAWRSTLNAQAVLSSGA